MTAHDEPSSLDSVAYALLLARQDIEALLSAEPAWQARQHLVGADGPNAARERELVDARLALVPAYRSLTRVNEALRGLASFVASQSANRSNNWMAGLTDATPALRQVAIEFSAGQAAEAGSALRPLSGWQSNGEASAPMAGLPAPSVDVDRLITLLRRGTKDRRPQPILGLLTGAASEANATLERLTDERRLVFPETVPDVQAQKAAQDAEPVELVPVRASRHAPEADVEIVVDEDGSSSGPRAIPVQNVAPPDPDVVTDRTATSMQPTDTGSVLTAAIGVRRFMTAWNDRGKR